MINGKKSLMSSALCEKSFGGEATGDFTLPDYQNEIRRILHVFPTVLPPAKYVGTDTVELSGTVDYQVVYIGGDGEIYSVPLSSNYSFTAPIERGGEENISVLCSIAAESVTPRVSGPRRLSIRTRLRTNIRVYAAGAHACEIDEGASVQSIYTRRAECPSFVCESASTDIIEVSYIAPMMSDDMRVTWADAACVVDRVECIDGGASVRGDVLLRLLCLSEESGEYSVIEGKIPYEGELELECATDECRMRAKGYTAELSVSVTDVGIECKAGIIIEATAFLPTLAEYTDDIYSTESECVCNMEAVRPRNIRYCDNINFTLSERVPSANAAIPENAQIIETMGMAAFDKCTLSGNKYLFSGNASFVVFYRNEGEIFAADVSIPVKYEAPAQEGIAPVCFDASGMATDVNARIADGNLVIDAELMMSADCVGECEIQMLCGVKWTDAVVHEDSELTVCYPSDGEGTWDIAKRYFAAPDSVIGDPATDKYVIIE